MKQSKFGWNLFMGLGCVGLVACLGVLLRYIGFLYLPLLNSQSIYCVFQPGSSARSLGTQLQKQGHLAYPRFLQWLAYAKGVTNRLKAGTYCFEPGTTPGQLLDQIASGKGALYHRFTLVEGWTLKQLYSALQQAHYLKPSLTILSPKNQEGMFFPETYFYQTGARSSDLLERAYCLMQRRLVLAWQARDPDLPYKTPLEALIAASLVEKETAQPEERYKIAEVIRQRLKRNMPLQIDASVIYGLGPAYMGRLTRSDLRRDTAYNTYTRRGLPPTPIAMPSFASIQAVLHPDKRVPFLYFVVTKDKKHAFSETLTDHFRAIRRHYLPKKETDLVSTDILNGSQTLGRRASGGVHGAYVN